MSDAADFSRGVCPSTLGKATPGKFSRKGIKALFEGKNVSPLLELVSPSRSAEDVLAEQKGRLSLSGMQEKYALLQVGKTLRLTRAGERGTHILKPIVSNDQVSRVEAMPANEHLSMQVAAQVFGIETAANGLVKLQDGGLAYLTRRFDYRTATEKFRMEDMASLAGYSPQTEGKHFKFKGNYLDVFMLLKKYVPAYRIEAEKFLNLLMFNYLICNGDAHLKNFSLLETTLGDFRLAPAYDLLNTELHIASEPFALDEGLLPSTHAGGKVHEEFKMLAELAELPKAIVERFIGKLLKVEAQVEALVSASFLPDNTKRQWLQMYQTRRARLER